MVESLDRELLARNCPKVPNNDRKIKGPPVIKPAAAGTVSTTNGDRRSVGRDSNSDDMNSERLPLNKFDQAKNDRSSVTKGVVCDVAKNERTPLTKALSPNGVPDGGMCTKNERYPLTNCATANGPKPADV